MFSNIVRNAEAVEEIEHRILSTSEADSTDYLKDISRSLASIADSLLLIHRDLKDIESVGYLDVPDGINNPTPDVNQLDWSQINVKL